MFPGEAIAQSASRHATELRRHAREARRLSIVLETRAGHLLRLPLIDVSAGGAKVRLTQQVAEGTRGRVYFLPPRWNPRMVEAIVWRIDLDGIVLRFTGSLGTPPVEGAVPKSNGVDSG
jgi:hypothetical protein